MDKGSGIFYLTASHMNKSRAVRSSTDVLFEEVQMQKQAIQVNKNPEATLHTVNTMTKVDQSLQMGAGVGVEARYSFETKNEPFMRGSQGHSKANGHNTR